MALDSDLRLKPVVAFDVDGVLRIRKDEDFEQGLFPVELTLEKDQFPTAFHGKPYWGEDGTIETVDHFSKIGVDFLRSTVARSDRDAVWATTWQHWANYYFAAPLGIPELPVAVKSLGSIEEDHSFRSSPFWKAHQLAEQFEGRPLVWIDDNMPERPGERLEVLRRPEDQALTLSHRVNPYTGLTEEDVELIEGWLAIVSTEQGQREMQRAEARRQETARRLEEERRARQEQAQQVYDGSRVKLAELFPGEDYFIRDLAQLTRYADGLSLDAIEYSLKRNSISADPQTIRDALWVEGYHRKRAADDFPIDDNF